jgi:hypothetical protein
MKTIIDILFDFGGSVHASLQGIGDNEVMRWGWIAPGHYWDGGNDVTADTVSVLYGNVEHYCQDNGISKNVR